MYTKLESLRGIAACFVVLFHFSLSFGDTPLRFISNSFLFVDLFFILSGFVISYAYEKKILEGIEFKSFVALRLGRIYPLHVATLLAFASYTLIDVYLYNPGIGGEQVFRRNNLHSFFNNLLLIHSLGVHDYLTWNFPSWSISVEFYTYVIFFFSLKYLEKSPTLIFPIIIVMCGYVWLSLLQRVNLDITYDYGLVRCLAGFYLGVLLYRTKEKIIISEKYSHLAEVVSFIFVIFSVSYARDGWYCQMLSVASFAFVIFAFSQSSSGIIGRILHFHIMRSAGVLSYSIYMTHALILYIATSFWANTLHIELSQIHGWTAVILNSALLIITVFVSRFTHHFVEDRFRKKVKEKIHKYDKKAAVDLVPNRLSL